MPTIKIKNELGEWINMPTVKGDKGDKGDTGLPGPTGPQGPAGTGVNILGSYDTLEELKAAHPTGNVGDAYMIKTNMYIWSETISDWTNVGNIQGPQGEKGVDGKSSTITVGTTTIGEEANVVNSGTENDAILDFTLPKGKISVSMEGIILTTTEDPNTTYTPKVFELDGRSTQNGIPTPDAPVEIQSIGDEGTVEIKLTGINILDMSNAKGGTDNGIACEVNEDGSYSFVGTATNTNINVWLLGGYGATKELFTLKAGTYFIKDCILFNITSQINTKDYRTGQIVNLTVDTPVTGVRVVSAKTGTTYNEKLYSMIVKSDIPVEWEKYKGNNYVIPTTPLRSLPDGTKDIAYIKDNKLYVERHVGSVVLNGSEGWFKSSRTDVNRYAIGSGINTIDNPNAIDILCSHFIAITPSSSNSGELGIAKNNGIGLMININRNDTNFDTLDKFITWLSSNNTEVIYKLAESVTEEIGNVYINFVEGTNNITNSSSANMRMEYYTTLKGDKGKGEDGIPDTLYANGADYAECFEWEDGNPENEDRRSLFVSIVNGTRKIRKAMAGDDILGITSIDASVVGNAAYKDNSAYSVVGMVGVIRVKDNGQCVVGDYVIPGDNGIAIPSTNDAGYKVTARHSDNLIEVLLAHDAEMISRIKDDIKNIPDEIAVSSTEPNNNEKVWIQKGKNLINPAGIMRNVNYNEITQKFETTDNWVLSGYIPIKINTNYIFSHALGTPNGNIVLFDENKKYLENINV